MSDVKKIYREQVICCPVFEMDGSVTWLSAQAGRVFSSEELEALNARSAQLLGDEVV